MTDSLGSSTNSRTGIVVPVMRDCMWAPEYCRDAFFLRSLYCVILSEARSPRSELLAESKDLCTSRLLTNVSGNSHDAASCSSSECLQELVAIHDSA
jgi:hypothetical protein